MATTLPRTSRIGDALSRVDGPLKTSGRARYAAEFNLPGLLHAVAVSSAIAKGRIAAIDASRALAQPGVVDVVTHQNRPDFVDKDSAWQDDVAPKGSPFRPLGDDMVRFGQQPVAVVIAETFEAARAAARMVIVDYEPETPTTDLEIAKADAYNPRSDGSYEKSSSRGDANAALATAAVKVEGVYRIAPEHHNPMEPHATVAAWGEDGSLTVWDKTQGAQNPQKYLAGIFDLSKDQVRVINPFMGGGFGCGLRPQWNTFLAAMAAKKIGRPVKLVLTRQQMFSHQYRPNIRFEIALGSDEQGYLKAIKSDAVQATSRFERNAENVVDWGPRVYRCDNAELDYKIAPVDTYTPGPMRAPGAATAFALFEIAMDELAYKVGIDPLTLRFRNYSDIDEVSGKNYTSKALYKAYEEGAEKFGWAGRSHEPRSMIDGRELVGWGMATGVWETLYQQHSVRARLKPDGALEVATASADIGTGTYTIMTQIASEEMGLPVDRIQAQLGDSTLPDAPVEGGSWGAASVGTALQMACRSLKTKLLQAARKLDDSPVANASDDQVEFADGVVRLKADPSRAVPLDLLVADGAIEVTESPSEHVIEHREMARNTHQAVFVEVKVDEELGQVRVTRVVVAVAAGTIINPKTARSQILGGVVMGLGMALHEESMIDPRIGRWMNHNLAEYHVPAHADVADIDVHFVHEVDTKVNPLGIKGLGEIGIVGTAAAVANAIFHATGTRVRSLPVTIDKVLGLAE